MAREVEFTSERAYIGDGYSEMPERQRGPTRKAKSKERQEATQKL
jgi:hypothetical protein